MEGGHIGDYTLVARHKDSWIQSHATGPTLSLHLWVVPGALSFPI